MTDKPRVLLPEPIADKAIALLRDAGIEVDTTTPDQVLDKIKDYDGLIVRSATKVTRDVIEAGERLKVVGRAGIGPGREDEGPAMRWRTGGAAVLAVAVATAVLVASPATAQDKKRGDASPDWVASVVVQSSWANTNAAKSTSPDSSTSRSSVVASGWRRSTLMVTLPGMVLMTFGSAAMRPTVPTAPSTARAMSSTPEIMRAAATRASRRSGIGEGPA